MSAPIGGTFPGGWGAVGAARKQQIRLVSIDFPTACWRVLFVLVVLAHQCRRVLRFHVTEHPTAAWTARQIVYAFPDDSAPAYLLRDRDTVYGDAFRQCVKGMRSRDVLTAAQSPRQNPRHQGPDARPDPSLRPRPLPAEAHRLTQLGVAGLRMPTARLRTNRRSVPAVLGVSQEHGPPPPLDAGPLPGRCSAVSSNSSGTLRPIAKKRGREGRRGAEGGEPPRSPGGSR